MKGRRAWKKALAGVLTGALLIGSVSAVSASTSVDNVDASGWWVSHSASIELQDGTETTITFNGQTYADATETWDVPNCVVYTADEAFTGGSGISDLSGYVEYYVARADAYGWSVGDYGYYEVISSPEADNYDEWAAYLEECKNGITGTITATLVGSTLVIDFVYGECETVFYITVDASKPVYLSLSGEYCTVTGISYDVEDVEWDVSVTLDDYEPFVGQEVTATVTILGNGIELTDLTNYYVWMWVDYWDDDHTDGITSFSEWYDGEDGKSFSKTFIANETGTCYLDVELKDSSDTQIYKTSATATVTEASTLTNVSTTLPSIELGDQFTMKGQTVTLTFEDGTTAEATFSYNYDVSCKGYNIYTNLYDSDNQYCSMVYTAGTYVVYLYVYDSDWNYVDTYTFELTVDELYALNVDAIELTFGESAAASIDVTGCQWFYYECTENDTYLFVSSDNDCDPYGLLFIEDEDGELSYIAYDDDTAGGGGNFIIKYALESGNTYYLKTKVYSTYNSDSSTANYNVTVTEAKAITSISVDSLAVSTFTQYQDYLDEYGTTLTVTYADDTTATVTFNNNSYAVDAYANYIYYYLADGETQYGAGTDILVDPGTYTLSFYTYDTADGSEATADTTVTVAEGDITVIELLETEYTTTASGEGEEVWFAYTPATDGQYYFAYSISTTSTDCDYGAYYSLLYVSDSSLSYLYPNYDESTDYNVYDSVEGKYYVYTLTAGTTYYFRCDYYDYSSNQVDATISVTAMQENHTHTYNDAVITWTWSDDYSTATAVLRCDTCSETVSLDATVTSTTGDSSIVYTATVSYNDVSYTDTVEVAVSDSATEETSETASTEDTESEEEDTEDADTEEEDTEDADSNEEDTEDTDNDEETIVLEETTLTSTTAWSSITTSALTVSGDSTTTYTITVDETYGSDWFSVEVYDADGNYITLNSDGTYWYYGTEGDDIVMTGSAITLEEGATYTVEIVRDGSDFTVTFYDEEGNELLSYYAANTNIDDTAATHVYAQVGSYTVSGEATGTSATLDADSDEEDSGEEDTDENTSDKGGSSDSDTDTGSSTVSDSPKTGDANLLLLALMAAFGCMITAISCKKKFLG